MNPPDTQQPAAERATLKERLAAVRAEIERAPKAAQDAFHRRLAGIERARKAGRKVGHAVASLDNDIKAAVHDRARRIERVPKLKFPADLPIVARKDDIAKAIAENQVVVICGETGSGKTTQLPKICLELGRGIDGLIGHTQPRRIAARSLANRIAQELDTPLGEAVGYKIRFKDHTKRDTYIKVMTDGILLAETQGDRDLRQYDTLILDEAHERSLNIDFLLGYVKQLLPRRPDLKVIITSATIDPQRFSEHFDGAPIVEVSGRTYPVEVRYRPRVSEDPDEQDRTEVEAIVDAIDELDRTSGRGDALVFLSGERQIRDTAEALGHHKLQQTEVLPLYSRLSTQEQDRVFKKTGNNRRIVLATNVAETSLTVPGIRYVIDPGTARISRYSPRSRVQRLPIEAISQASADQRKGRCGRVSDGVCIRLYDEADFANRQEFTDPEILRTNLAAVILQMKALKLGDISSFPFIDPPPGRMISDGLNTLREIGALDKDDRLTSLGSDLARLPIDPRIGRMIVAAHAEDCLKELLVIAAALTIQDPRERPHDRQQEADEAHAQWRDGRSDFLSFLKLWDAFHEQQQHLSGNKLRKWCRSNSLSFLRMREWQDVHRQLRELATETGMRLNDQPAAEDRIHRAVLAGLLSQIGVKGAELQYTGPGGRKFVLFPGSALYKRPPKWVVAAELVETTRLYARTVAAVEPAWLESVGEHLLKRSYSNARWSNKRQAVEASERVMLFGLPVVRSRPVHFGPIDPLASRDIFVREALVNQQIRSSDDFIEHNQRILDEARAMQDKLRLNSLVIDEEGIFAFYDLRVPAGVYNTRLFERWLHEAQRRTPDILHMKLEDALQRPVEMACPTRFPDSLDLGRLKLPLSYRAEPGHEEDGVTLHVPLPVLGQVPMARLTYLVPGMLHDKIVALIKALPKSLRKLLAPAPDTADACVSALAPSLTMPLATQLSRVVREMRGVEVSVDAWDVHALPDHLRMKVAVLGRQNEIMAASRDGQRLQHELEERSRQAFANLAGPSYNRDRLLSWNFGDLPAEVQVQTNGITLTGYPALVDRGDSVSLQLLETKQRASYEMRLGLRRLFMMVMRRDLGAIIDRIESIDQLSLYYASKGGDRKLREQLKMAIVDRACVEAGPEIRTQVEFENRVEAGWHKLDLEASKLSRLLLPILKNYHAVAVAIDQASAPVMAAVVADVKEQIEGLMPDGFISDTPAHWLAHYPRYLAGIHARLAKATAGGLARDEQLSKQIQPWQLAYHARAQQHRERGLIDPELQQFRWMLEEMRVSLFAQELKTAIPVSQERLKKQWAKIRL